MPTHEEVLAAIERKRRSALEPIEHTADRDEQYPLGEVALVVFAHCDDLRATAERHAPKTTLGDLTYCPHDALLAPDAWPCPDYQQVIDRLTAWGYPL